MPNNYVAPYLISTDRPANIPSTGTFTVPVCTTKERYEKITNALFAYGAMQGNEFDFDHLIDWLDALPRIVEGCVEFNEQCRNIALNDERIQWFPESPYHPNSEIPDGYDNHPWTIASQSTIADIIISWGLGYKNGDVFTDFTKAPDITDPTNFTEAYLNLPRFRVTGLVGKGTLKVDILAIPLGGRLVVLVDEFVDLLNLQAADTDRDFSFPPESIVSLTIETEITTEGEHTVDYVFYPTFETELPIIGFGGGLRSIQLCGFGVTPMPTESCCDETNELLQKIYLLLKSGIKGEFKFGDLPNSVDLKVDCTPENFDGNEADTIPEADARTMALCITVSRYIIAILYNVAVQFNAGVTIKSNIKSLITPLAIPNEFTSELEETAIPITDFDPLIIAAMDIITLSHLATDFSPLVDSLICAMIANLSGKPNTFANFKISVSDRVDPTDEESIDDWLLHRLLLLANGSRPNFIVFSKQLESTFDEVNEGLTYECPCAPPPPEECASIVLVNASPIIFPDTVITHVIGNTWRIQNASTDTTGFGVCGAAIEDANGCCFDTIANPEGYGTQGINQHQDFYCDMTDGTVSPGGGAGNCLRKYSWDQGDATPVDTYITVQPHVGEIC